MVLIQDDIFAAREFAFTADDFDYLRKVITSRIGIAVADSKREMFYSRLTRRLRALGMSDFKQYCELIKGDKSGKEVTELVNAITTNLTSFFRETHHFEFLLDTVIPELQKDLERRKLRIWSAGCSTGEEPYSIAMTLCESQLVQLGWDLEILASDVDSNVLAKAASGEYSMERVSDMDYDRLKSWFLRGKGNHSGMVKIKRDVQKLVKLHQLNLITDWSLPEQMDVVFCRNVIIYFDKETKKAIVERIANSLRVGGYLFLGHSESLFRVSDRFELIGNTIYRKLY